MKVRDLINNPTFDCNCNCDIFDCTETGISWHDASPVFGTTILDSEPIIVEDEYGNYVWEKD